VRGDRGIAAAMLAFLEPRDDVVMFEPSYDSYAAAVSMAGATRTVVTLEPPHWGFDVADLEAAVGPRTRLLLLNSRTTRPARSSRSTSCVDRRALRSPRPAGRHRRGLRAPDLRGHPPAPGGLPRHGGADPQHLLGGKTFGFTGWKVGWVSGPAPLVAAVRAAKQFLTYVTPAPSSSP